MLSSIAAAWPRAKLPKHEVWSGHRFTLDRLFTLLTGVFSAFLIWIWERYLPRAVTWTRLGFDNVWRAESVDAILLRNDVSYRVRLLAFVLRVAWVLCVCDFIPEGLKLLVDAGFSRFFLGAIAAWIEYLLSDCPPGKAQASWVAQSDATLGFFMFTYGITRPLDFVSIVYKTAFWTFMIVANWASEWSSGVAMLTAVVGFDISAMISPTVDWLPSWLYWPSRIVFLTVISVTLQKVRFRSFEGEFPLPEWSRIPGILVMKLALLAEIYEYLEVAALEYLPKSLQRGLYFYQKERRRNRGVADYQYLSLKSGEIRLLVLSKANFPICGTLEARIVHVPLSPTLEYEAVSYRWGDPALVEEIIVEGARLKITSSAFEVLLAHRSTLRERVVWIDAICINQADNHEKGEQVRIMSEIYKTAYRVVLFPHGDWRARLAVGLIYQHGLGPPAEAPSAQALDLRDLMLEGRSPIAPRWEAMARLLAHEYFNRAWIVQEIAVARKVELCLGGIYVPWEIFHRAVLMMQQPAKIARLHNDHFNPPVGFLHFHDVYFLNSLRYNDSVPSHGLFRTHAELTQLESVLYITSDFRASDPRDKVYAMLGIVNETHSKLSLRPDYTIPVERVFEDVSYHLFCNQDNPSVNILTFAGYGYPREKRLKQSWIPQLLQSRTRIPFTNLLLSNPRFRACGKTEVRITAGPLSGSLLIQGRLCDTILAISSAEAPKVSGISQERGPDRPAMLQMLEFMNFALSLIQAHPQKFPDNPLAPDSHIWHALTADGDLTVSHEDFQGWRRSLESAISADGKPAERLRRMHQTLSQNSGYLVFFNNMAEASSGRCFAVTASGRLCLVPPDTYEGDVVFIPGGAQTPYVFRRKAGETPDCYVLIGEAYVQGIMRGELMTDMAQLTDIMVL